MTSAYHDVMVTTSKVSNDVGVKIRYLHSTEHTLRKNRIFEDTKLKANVQWKGYKKQNL